MKNPGAIAVLVTAASLLLLCGCQEESYMLPESVDQAFADVGDTMEAGGSDTLDHNQGASEAHGHGESAEAGGSNRSREAREREARAAVAPLPYRPPPVRRIPRGR